MTYKQTPERIRSVIASFIRKTAERTSSTLYTGRVLRYDIKEDVVIQLTSIAEDVRVSWKEKLLYIFKDQIFKENQNVILAYINGKFVVLGELIFDIKELEERRGRLIATSSSLPSSIASGEIVSNWNITSQAPLGFAKIDTVKVAIPEIKPTGTVGLIADIYVSDVLKNSVAITWGDIGRRYMVIDRATLVSFNIRTSGDLSASPATYQHTFLMRNENTTIPSNTIVKVYEWVN